MFRPGVQKCCRALSPRDQKLGVRERDYAATYQCLVHRTKHFHPWFRHKTMQG